MSRKWNKKLAELQPASDKQQRYAMSLLVKRGFARDFGCGYVDKDFAVLGATRSEYRRSVWTWLKGMGRGQCGALIKQLEEMDEPKDETAAPDGGAAGDGHG
jgi:hypothetical protein